MSCTRASATCPAEKCNDQPHGLILDYSDSSAATTRSSGEARFPPIRPSCDLLRIVPDFVSTRNVGCRSMLKPIARIGRSAAPSYMKCVTLRQAPGGSLTEAPSSPNWNTFFGSRHRLTWGCPRTRTECTSRPSLVGFGYVVTRSDDPTNCRNVNLREGRRRRNSKNSP